ncbi:MAG: hypothetical protein Q8P95_02630 [bacterium]|nr:hypothetical protein [bacterium]
MNKLLKLAKVTARQAFKSLRERSPLYCTALGQEVYVGRTFFQHISFAKKRTRREIIERLLIIPCVEEILTSGVLTEKREKSGESSFRIDYLKSNYAFSVIVLKSEGRHILLSCFCDET